jgi:hypothetical protein
MLSSPLTLNLASLNRGLDWQLGLTSGQFCNLGYNHQDLEFKLQQVIHPEDL